MRKKPKRKSAKNKKRNRTVAKAVRKSAMKSKAVRRPEAKRKSIRKRRVKRLVLPSRWSSSTLSYHVKHCIKALDFKLRGEFIEPDVFIPGIAAHAMIQECGRLGLTDYDTIKETCNRVWRNLIEKGRVFYGVREAPMNPEHASRGRTFAINYLAFNPLPKPAQYEVTFSIDGKGEPCKFEDARLTAKIDCSYFTADENEELPGRVFVVQDWKSSWSTGEADLDTLQRKIQMLMGWKHHGKNCVGIKAVVVNLQTGKQFSRLVKLDEDGLMLLAQWEREIFELIDVVEKLLSARMVKGIPGVGCYNCPFVRKCRYNKTAIASKDDAVAYTAMLSRLSEIRKRLLIKTENESVSVPGGFVGYNRTKRNVRKSGAEKSILAKWHNKTEEQVGTENGGEVGLLDVLELGVRSIYKFGKKRISNPKERSGFFDKTLEETGVATFGFWPDDKVRLEELLSELNGDSNGTSKI